MHLKTQYTSTCGSNGHGLTIQTAYYSQKCVLYGALDPLVHDHDATIPNGTVTIGRTSLVDVGHSGSDLIVPLMLRMVCFHAMAGALTLYCRSLGIASTLLRRGKISGKPYMGVMTYNALVFSALKQLDNYHRFYNISFESPKTS